MKKLFVALCALSLTFTAKAQENISESVTSTTSTATTSAFDSYGMWYVQYDGISIDKLDLTGISVGFSGVGPISKNSSAPFSYELGLEFQYAFGSKNDYDYTMYSFKVPLSFGYHYAVNENVTIAPYAGVHIRWYLGGKMKNDDYDLDYELFDDGDDGCDWKSFQIGWQIGARAVFKKVTLGVSYGASFSDMMEDGEKLGAFSATLGFKF